MIKHTFARINRYDAARWWISFSEHALRLLILQVSVQDHIEDCNRVTICQQKQETSLTYTYLPDLCIHDLLDVLNWHVNTLS